jgi:hypothetical protein
MAAQIDKTQTIGLREPYGDASMQQPGTKERFYRYFQEEVTGMILVS